MKSSDKDQIQGKIRQMKGQVKETVGNIVGNPDLEAEGIVENVVGKVQEKVGQVKKVFGK